MKVYRRKSGIKGREPRWYVDYVDPTGKRIQRYGGKTKEEAEQVLAQFRVEMREGRYFDRKTLKETKLSDLIDSYKKYFAAKDSYKTECYHLAAILNHFGKDKLISQITLEDVIAFRAERLAVPAKNSLPTDNDPDKETRPRSSSTVNREVWCLKRLLYYAIDTKLLRENPAHKVEALEEPTKRVSYLSVEEAGALLDAAKTSRNKLLYSILLTALETGMRRTEILSLRACEIDWETRQIHLAQTKNGTDRYVPMSETLYAHLKTLPPKIGQALIFANDDGEQMHDVRTGFEVARKKANIPDTFRFHDLRHTFVTHALSNNTPPNVVAEIVGHTLVAMLEKYGHVLDKMKRQAVNALPNWGGRR